MISSIDQAAAALEKLLPEWNKLPIEQMTEADTRAQIIDQMLEKVLGWNNHDIKREKYSAAGFSDYLLRSATRSLFVLEAKRTSNLLISTASTFKSAYLLHGPALKDASEGIKQAIGYCVEESVAFAALSSGFQWIAFRAIRTDGSDKKQHKAIVFPTLDSIRDSFAQFYDLFSLEGVLEKRYEILIGQAEGMQTHFSEPLTAVVASNKIRMLLKNNWSSDLEKVFNKFFGNISGNSDPEMLVKCFVETPESKATDVALAKIAERLANEIKVVEPGYDSNLQATIQGAIDAKEGEFVLLVGNKGAGKSTFTERFFSLVLKPEIKAQCFIVTIDLGANDGDEAAIRSWLAYELRNELVKKLFAGEPPTYEQLQGIFFDEYKAWCVGAHKALYISDKNAFKIKFGEYIDELIRNRPIDYAKALLRRIIRSDRLMPCIIFDNADHHTQAFQNAVFQFSQSLFKSLFLFVLLPVTDRTLWQLGKSGPMQSYQTKSYYLPVPSTKDILKRRISFIKEKLDSYGKDSGEYFTERGIKIRFENLQAFAASLEEIFVDLEYTSRTVSWLSNHDIRRSLLLTKRVFTSPWVKIEELFKTYAAGHRLAVSKREVYRSIFLGEYSHFQETANDFVLNVFSVAGDDLSSPFVIPSIIQYLYERESASNDSTQAYVPAEEIEHYFEAMQVPVSVVRRSLQALLDRRLIEPFDPTSTQITDDRGFKVTFSGKMHLEFCLGQDQYLTEMTFTTGMRNGEHRDKLGALNAKRHQMTSADYASFVSCFAEYICLEDSKFVKLPPAKAYDGQRRIRNDFRVKWGVTS